MASFVDNIVGFSLKNKIFVLMMTVVMVIAGIYSYLNTPIEAFPDVTNTQVVIITQWQGRSAEEIEKFITLPIEIAMNSVQKRSTIRSISLFGLSVITIIFDDGVDDSFARQQVNNLLMNVELPEGINAEVQPPYGPTGEIFRYTLVSDTKDIRELTTIQDWVVERALKSVPGVADIVSFGGEEKVIEVAINPHKLYNHHLTSLDVFEALAKSNINIGGDVILKNNQAFVVRGIGLIDNIAEIENLIIDVKNSIPILVKNVADVHVSSKPILGQVGRGFEDNVVQGIVIMRKAENPSKVIEAVKAKMDELNKHILPNDVNLVTFYDREELIQMTVKTVMMNLIEGIIFVTVVVFLFMADWRTTVIVAIIVPLSLLFAFTMLRMMGMSANLISIGAIDFGIIIDGAVIMVEGLFVTLDNKAKKLGMERFNQMSKLGLIKNASSGTARVVFFSKLIIITALIPIFSFEKVEGKMFSPLAFTLGFALLGALILTLTLVPLLTSMMLNKNVREKHNFFVIFVTKMYDIAFAFVYKRKRMALSFALGLLVVTAFIFKTLGTEFLPTLNEGSIYIRATMPLSISIDESVKVANDIRRIIMQYDEVDEVLSQTGRPNDGTDPTGFYNIEFHVALIPRDEWKSGISYDELVENMREAIAIKDGIVLNFSQPIMDNVEEAVSGVKGSIAARISGYDLNKLDIKAKEVYNILKDIEGIDDLGIVKNMGQPEVRINLDQVKMAAYGIVTEDAQAVIEMAIGGKTATQFYEEERRFDIRVRYQPEFRELLSDIESLMVPTIYGNLIPIKQIAEVEELTGPITIYRINNQRFIAVKFSIRGRDMGSTMAEAMQKVEEAVTFPQGLSIEWKGDYENQERATKRLQVVVPISLFVIFLILFFVFGNVKDATLVLLNIPFAIIGGVIALYITGFNFSISAGIGFIILFGICIQQTVLLLSDLRRNVRSKIELNESIFLSVRKLVRPILMTGMLAAVGLTPAALATGIGSETSKPLAIVVIGGLVTATTLTLLIFPLVFYYSEKLKSKFRSQ
jgi:heavy metal efflux system protein